MCLAIIAPEGVFHQAETYLMICLKLCYQSLEQMKRYFFYVILILIYLAVLILPRVFRLILVVTLPYFAGTRKLHEVDVFHFQKGASANVRYRRAYVSFRRIVDCGQPSSREHAAGFTIAADAGVRDEKCHNTSLIQLYREYMGSHSQYCVRLAKVSMV